VYLEKAFDGTGFRPKEGLPNVKLLGETSIQFLVHPTLTENEIKLTQDVLRAVFAQAAK
jgi:dTDP-4-amino-4,6-dideoxygalactose transaminase